MKRKLWVLCLGFVLFFVPLGSVARAGQATAAEPSKPAKQTGPTEQTRQSEQTAKIKTEIGKRVANNKTKVKFKLRSGAEMKGRLNQADDDNFTFTDEKTKQEMTVAYADVEQVKGRGGLSLGAKIGIIAGIVVTVAVVAVVVSFHNFDPFKNGIVVR